MIQENRGTLFVLSGPSGTGKGTICQALLQEMPVALSISATTRAPRGEEQNGREYFFLSKEEFEALRDEDGLLEWAQVYDNYYGTPRAFVEEQLDSGKDCILEIDPQGAMQVRQTTSGAVLVYLAPPSLEELRERLTGRGTETAEQVEKRLSAAASEMEYIPLYDYLVVNDALDVAINNMKAILTAERCRLK